MNSAIDEPLDVRIIELPHFRVASVVGKGPEPEQAGWMVLLTWARANGYLTKPRRFFGHNVWTSTATEEQPTPYDYEVWMTLEPNENPGKPIKIKDFRGGLYAVLRVKGAPNLPAAWEKLTGWMKQSEYHQGLHQWLEEHLEFMDMPAEEMVFDLHLPLRK